MFEGAGATTSSFPVTSGAVQPQRHRKIAIIGFGETAKDCPWQDPSWELWGMNGFWRAAEPDHGVKAPEERYSLWFDMHTLEFTRIYGERSGIAGKQEAWLRLPHPFDILMLGPADPAWPEVSTWPSVREYPLEMVLEKLGRDYFTSTVAYAIALAATMDDVAEIGLWGIDLTHDTEYVDQRPCAEYWTARAEGMGIKITIHEQSAMLKQLARYGFEIENPLLIELHEALTKQAEGLQGAIAKSRAAAEAAFAQAQTDDGALQITRGLIGRLATWRRGGRI